VFCVSCDEGGCVVQMSDGAFIALAQRSEALNEDCERAGLVVTARQPPALCPAAVIDRQRLRKHGALAVRRSGGGFKVEAANPTGTDRPWSPAVPDDAELEALIARRPAVGPSVDATPSESDVQADD